MKWQLALLGILLSINAFSDGYKPSSISEDQPWSVIGSFGTGHYQITSKDNHNAIGRLAVANELLLTGDYALGLELGLQNGNHMKINLPQTISFLQWLPVRTNLGPMLDLLITAKSDPLGASDFFALVKGGIAYRYWQIHQNQYNTINQVTGEIQAGFGYPISALANLSLLYQGVYGNKPQISFDLTNQKGHVSTIPALHAILVSLSVNL